MAGEKKLIAIATASKETGIPVRTLNDAAAKGLLWHDWIGSQRVTTMEAVYEFRDKHYVPRPRKKS